MHKSISGLVAEYIVAIDVTWVRFPADAQVKLARLVRQVTKPRGGRVCDSRWSPQGHFGEAAGGPEVPTLLWSPAPLHAAPHSGESPVAVVPVTLRDPVLV